jgi:hypothetical protein
MAFPRRRFLACVLIALCSLCAFVAHSRAAVTADSLRIERDSSRATSDSLFPRHPLPIFPSRGNDTLIDQRLLLEHSVNETIEALHWSAPFLALDPFAPGIEPQLLIDGLDTRHIAVRVLGRPLNDPITGRASLLSISPDLFEQVEGTRAPHAAVDGIEGAATLDGIPRSYNTNRPYVRVRYDQRPAEYIASDVEFSQNISRPLNVMFGITRESQVGAYVNSGLQFWNVRGSMRWFPDATINGYLLESFTHNIVGENGGLYPDDVLVNTTQARVYLGDGHTDMARHDLTAGARWQPHGDSSIATDLTVYVSTIDRSFTATAATVSGVPLSPFAEEDFHEYASWYGMEARQSVSLSALDLRAGVSTMHLAGAVGTALQPISELRLGGYVDASLHPIAGMELRPFVRFDRVGDRSRPAFGIEGGMTVGAITLRAGLSRTERVPTPQERAWNGPVLFGAATDNEKHATLYAGARWHSSGFDMAVDVNARTISNAIAAVQQDSMFVMRNDGDRTVYGAAGSMHWTRGWFEARGVGNITIEQDSGVQLRRYPVFTGTLGLYYHARQFLGVPLELKAGVETWAASGFVGERYLPSSGATVPAITYETGPNGALDWIVMVHLGSAYIRLGVSNFLGRRPYLVPFYPELWQAFHLGVTWVMYD